MTLHSKDCTEALLAAAMLVGMPVPCALTNRERQRGPVAVDCAVHNLWAVMGKLAVRRLIDVCSQCKPVLLLHTAHTALPHLCSAALPPVCHPSAPPLCRPCHPGGARTCSVVRTVYARMRGGSIKAAGWRIASSTSDTTVLRRRSSL